MIQFAGDVAIAGLNVWNFATYEAGQLASQYAFFAYPFWGWWWS